MLRNHEDSPEALARLERNSPFGRILAEVLRMRHAPRESLRDAVETVGQGVAQELNRYIRPSAPSPWSHPSWACSVPWWA